MGIKKHTIWKAIFFVVLFFGLTVNFDTVCAQNNNKTVTIRVAFCPLDGFFEYDEKGNPCGYGVDYLNELKKYGNFNWKYVPVDSWEKIGELMSQGKVDVYMPVSEPSTPSKKYEFTVEPILSSYHVIMTTKEREDLYYKDYDKIATLKLAITRLQDNMKPVDTYLKSIGVKKNLVFFNDYNDCKKALEEGKVDGVVTNVMDLTDNLKILDKFAVSKNYIITMKNSPFYSLINSAMTELQLVNPSFQNTLYKEYYPERSLEPYTKQEQQYIHKNRVLTVAVYKDRRPVSYLDEKTNTYKGIAIDIMKEIARKMGVRFKFILITTKTPAEMLNIADLAMPVTNNLDWSKYFTTSSILDTKIMMVVRSSDDEPDEGAKVGVLASTRGIASKVKAQSNYKLVKFTSNKEALQALLDGQIQAFVNSSYVLNWMLENPRYSKLRLLNYESLPMEFLVCGKEKDKILQSILNKTIPAVTESDAAAIVKENTIYNMNNLSIGDKLYVYRLEICMGVAIFIFLFAAMMIHNGIRTKYIAQIEEKNRQQERANRAKSSFLSRMSHDMRTPMNAIIGMSYLGINSNSMEELKDYHQKINQSGKYLLGLINDTLDMTKMENDKMELHPEPYLSSEFMDSMKVMFMEKTKEKNIHLEIATNYEKPFTIMADKLRLQQIFVNLINNAIKFSYRDGRVKFTIFAEKINDDEVKISFTVQDYGCGMTEAFQKKMYDPFEQGDEISMDNEAGTGLGLSIVKRIVDLMQGTITCHSELGKGTKFVVTLTAPVCKEETVTEQKVEKKELPAVSLKGKRVLLCEDHPLNVQIATKLLEKEGMQVEMAANGEKGLYIFSHSEPGYFDVVLMDIRMPIMNGLETAKQIRMCDRPDAKTIPIIAMTANAFEEDINASKAAGMNAHLAKPIDARLLYSTLRKYC